MGHLFKYHKIMPEKLRVGLYGYQYNEIIRSLSFSVKIYEIQVTYII